jgi:hypothetical protein
MAKVPPHVAKLRSLMAASTIFRRVIKACNYASANNLDQEIEAIFKAGIVVTYMTPFRHGAGFEKLGEEFTRFSGRDDLKHLNADLVNSRNSIYAHYGPKKARELLKHLAAMQEFDKVKITFRTIPTTTYGQIKLETKYTINHVNLLDENFPKLIELCEYHAGLVEIDINALVKKIYDSHNYPDGDYILGENFP